MKSCLIILSVLVGGLASHSAAPGPESDSTNPALLYWQAAAVLPALSDAQAMTLIAISDGDAEVDFETLEWMEFEETERFLKKAANSDSRCDWGLSKKDGFRMLVPHLAKMREFSTWLLAQAEVDFAAGRVAEGIERLLLSHQVARDAGAGEYLLGFAVQTALEKRSLAATARHSQNWDEPARLTYVARYESLPTLHSLYDCYRGEASLLNAAMEENPEQTAELRKFHAEMLTALLLPVLEREQAVTAVEKRYQNSAISHLMPNLTSIVRQESEIAELQKARFTQPH